MQSIGNKNRRESPSWDVEYVQRRVVEITCETLGFRSGELTLESCFGEEIAIDSLDLMDYFLRLEAEFDIHLSDSVLQQCFPRLPISLSQIAETLLELCRDAGPIPLRQTPTPLPRVESAVATQMGGKLSRSRWLAGTLHEPLGFNREGCRQYRRCTDGMRCVLIPEGQAWIGSSAPCDLPVQQPRHPVRLSAFLIDAEPVSNRAFARFLNSVAPIPPAVLREWCLFEGKDRREAHFPLRRGWWRGWRPIAGTELAACNPRHLVWGQRLLAVGQPPRLAALSRQWVSPGRPAAQEGERRAAAGGVAE